MIPDTVWHIGRVLVSKNGQLVWSIMFPEAVNSFVAVMRLHKHCQLLLLLLLLAAGIILHTFQLYSNSSKIHLKQYDPSYNNELCTTGTPTTLAALPNNSDASAAYHYKWRNVYFELSQTQ